MPKVIDKEKKLTRFISFRVSDNVLQKLKEKIGDEPRRKGNFFRSVVTNLIQPNDSNSNQTLV